MNNWKLEGHEDSLLPSGKDWKLVWNDEFDGTELDRSKWGFRLNFWGKRFPAYTDKGAFLDGESHLKLTLQEYHGQYCSPHLQTGSLLYDNPRDKDGFWPFGKTVVPKFMHKFGYYEVRCKLQEHLSGWNAAFWLQSPNIGSTLDPRKSGVECDILETWGKADINRHALHWNGYGSDYQGIGSGDRILTPTEDGFHWFGVDWTPDGYTFYIDGKESWQTAGVVSHTEQFILLSTECQGYRSGAPCDALKTTPLPDYFVIDHVRVFDDVNL